MCSHFEIAKLVTRVWQIVLGAINLLYSSLNTYHGTISHTEKTGELLTSLPMGCTWATEWLPMGILPCKLSCPLLPYMETVGSSVGNSVGSPLLPKYKNLGSSVGSGVGCPSAAHWNFAMKIRLPTTYIYGDSWQLSGQLSGQPTTLKNGNSGQFSSLGCPLLPYKETVDSSVGSPLLPNLKKWAAQWTVEWAAHGLPMGILPCKLGCPLLTYMVTVGSSVGNSVHGQPTTLKNGNSGQFSGQPTDLRTIKFKMEAIFDSHSRHL